MCVKPEGKLLPHSDLRGEGGGSVSRGTIEQQALQQEVFFLNLFNAFLQSTPSGVISKSGDGYGLGEEVVQ